MNKILNEINRRGILPALGTPFSGGDCIEQSPRELAEFCEWLNDKNIDRYLEVGISSGGTFKFVAEWLNVNIACGMDIKLPRVAPIPCFLCICDCRSEIAHNFVKSFGMFDLIFIDASHDYEGVKKDFEIYGGLGKIIAFHDICGLRDCEGSKKVWEEVKQSRKVIEFIDAGLPVGIGVILNE
jgi:hypothetical protein